MALAPVEPSCVTLAWTSKDIFNTEGSCVTLCRAIRKVTFQTCKVGMEVIASSSRIQQKKQQIGEVWHAEGGKTEVAEDGNSAMSMIWFCKKWNLAILLTDTCPSSRKPLGVLLEVVRILMLSIVAHKISAVFCSCLVINNYHMHLSCIYTTCKIFLFELKVFG